MAEVSVEWAAHKVAGFVIGENCGVCSDPAAHKVEEAPEEGAPFFSQYLCCRCFVRLMGPAADDGMCRLGAGHGSRDFLMIAGS